MDINVTTYLNQLGYGIVGLNVVKALKETGHNPALWINGAGEAPEAYSELLQSAIKRAETYNTKAPSLRIAHQNDMAHRVGIGTHSGLTFFELDPLTPAEVYSLSNLDVVFFSSQWSGEVMARSGVPLDKLHYCPLGVDGTLFNPSVKPDLNVPGGSAVADWLRTKNTTVFLNVGKWEVRKGHDVLAEAFSRAFTPNDNVCLIMHNQNVFLTPSESDAWASTYENSPMGERVMVNKTRFRKQDDIASMMALADCGVFPSRAEGWNMELAEMMAMGKQVITTNYSAHTEFCTPNNSRLIQITELEDAYDGTFFKTGFGSWARFGEEQMEQLVVHMRNVHTEKQSGALPVNQEGIETFKSFTWERTALQITKALRGDE